MENERHFLIEICIYFVLTNSIYTSSSFIAEWNEITLDGRRNAFSFSYFLMLDFGPFYQRYKIFMKYLLLFFHLVAENQCFLKRNQSYSAKIRKKALEIHSFE